MIRPGTTYEQLIASARTGDSEAFAELMKRFEAMATGLAYAWLRDAELTRDVVQEAFLDAYLHLGDLKQPAAFPGWLRRIVSKHCDRITRRGEQPLPDAEESASEEEPLAALAWSETVTALGRAIESLPPAQRQVIALQYFAEASGPEIARFLELPLSTIKKRLRAARARLSEGEISMPAKKPTPANLSREVMFYIALRNSDLDGVCKMLDAEPALLETQFEWSPELVYQGILPFANKATPLITAVELGDDALLALLLDRGADADGRCGCTTGEAPLWAAALFGHKTMVDQLLAAGADPDRYSSAGNTALHVAVMRGHTEIVQALLGHGARALPDRAPANTSLFSLPERPAIRYGRTPQDWAAQAGDPAMRELLATAAVAEPTQEALVTGIKAVDFFAPLPRQGLVRVTFGAGVGMLVLMAELIRRFRLRHSDGKVVWTGFTQPPFDLREWDTEFAEFGLSTTIARHLESFEASPAARRQAFASGLDAMTAATGRNQPLFGVITVSEGYEVDVEASLPRLLDQHRAADATVLVVSPFRTGQTPQALASPYRAQLVFSREMANNHVFPAIDPRYSTSALTLDPELATLRDSVADRHQAGDAELRDYFSQPFGVVEPFTGRPGTWVMPDTLRADLRSR